MRAIAIAIAIGIATLFAPAIVAWVAGHWLCGFSHHGFGSPRARRLFLKRHLRHLDSARGWGVPTVADEADQEWQEGSPRPRSGARCQGCVAVGGRTSSTAPGRPAGGGSAVWPGPGLVRNLTRWPTLFSFHGIPVKIHVPLLAGLVCSLLALVIPANGLLADILRFQAILLILWSASSVVHELGHALVARKQGSDVEVCQTLFLGATVVFNPQPGPGALLRRVLAGPAMTAAVIAVCVLAKAALTAWPGGGSSLQANTTGGADLIITWVLFLNLLLLVVKLVPGLPLDGGHALVGIVWKLAGDRRRGGRIAAAIGLLTGLFLVLFAIVAMAVLPGVWGSALPLFLMPIGALGLWQIWMCWGGMLWLGHYGQLRIRDALVTAPTTADASTTAEAAWRQLFARHLDLLWVPVLGPVGHYMGMAHRGVVETAARSSPRRELAELAQLPEDDPLTDIVSPDTALQDAMENSAILREGVLIVLDRFGRFSGVARRDEIKRRFLAGLAGGRDPGSSHLPGG